ncbi:DNA-processing protein DprA [Pseudactinotalea sp. HY158]|uniref:DNA-processing protein DprA n=1 Tax=Pseudactinotalea sp. HY158 TaxID=2654547 RepID=UPI00129CC947|nr:DNA-processing protein DprA [Pseudactinotalea sp. HY158]QGH70085.1 DNA-processing protein DprA [Pseudactinotalea sp. HY158]
MGTRDREFAALLTLLRHRRHSTGWGEIAADVAAAGSAVQILSGADGPALFGDPELEAGLARATAEVTSWAEAGHRWLTVLDADYPSRLFGIRETPPFLFYQGTLQEHDQGMSVVGSRSASDHGLHLADRVARHLASRDLTVIAGLADGIDTAAHRAALDVDGRTVAVLGTGITKSYPASNRTLQQEIATRGLLLSQSYPEAAPSKQSFPMRNATMSGYGLATIVIEAGEHSGTRIQARLACEHGRPVILTSRVARTTTWGIALATRPNVFVVDSFDELTQAITEVCEAPARLRGALDELASA